MYAAYSRCNNLNVCIRRLIAKVMLEMLDHVTDRDGVTQFRCFRTGPRFAALQNLQHEKFTRKFHAGLIKRGIRREAESRICARRVD